MKNPIGRARIRHSVLRGVHATFGLPDLAPVPLLFAPKRDHMQCALDNSDRR